MEPLEIFWTEYMKYRVELRGYNFAMVEDILRYSSERYTDTVTGRLVAVGRHDQLLAMIPYEQTGSRLQPVTIHATSRQQINFRIKTGRLKRI